MSTEIKIIEEHRGQVLLVQKAANEYVATGALGVEEGERFLKDIKDIETALTTRKEEITRPLMKSLSSIRDLFKPLELGLTDAKKTIKAKILAYTIEQETKAQIEVERLEKRVEKGTMKAETAAGKLATIESSKVKANTRTLRKLSIVDETLIPRSFLVPDREKITKALFAGEVVSGAALVEEKILATRR